MADTMQFDLVSPEKKLASVQATMVELPGMEGDMAAMPNHSPTVTTLRPGIVRIHADGGTTEYAVTGGFAEISAEGTTVLAEQAMERSELTRDALEAMAGEAEAGIEGADEATRTSLAQRANDLRSLAGDMGL